MKKIFILVFALAVLSCLIFSGATKTSASSLNSPKQIAETCDTQDPYSPCFAPGEKADGSATDSVCDTQDPYSPCFAPGEKADDPTPTYFATPTPVLKTVPTATPIPQASYPSKEDILDLTRDNDSGGVGLLGALMLSPIMSIIVFFIGFIIFIGFVILVIVLLTRRSNNKDNKSEQPNKSDKENGSK